MAMLVDIITKEDVGLTDDRQIIADLERQWKFTHLSYTPPKNTF